MQDILIVEDNQEIVAIFDSFYRGSNSRQIQGSGLGLYICKNLMKKMEGMCLHTSAGIILS